MACKCGSRAYIDYHGPRHSVRQAGRSAREAMYKDSKLLRNALVSDEMHGTVSCGRRGGFQPLMMSVVCRPAAPARLLHAGVLGAGAGKTMSCPLFPFPGLGCQGLLLVACVLPGGASRVNPGHFSFPPHTATRPFHSRRSTPPDRSRSARYCHRGLRHSSIATSTLSSEQTALFSFANRPVRSVFQKQPRLYLWFSENLWE